MEDSMKIFIMLVAIILLFGCAIVPGEDYLTYSQYTTLLGNLQGTANISKSTITTELSSMGVASDYEYTYYQSGNYICHNFNWSYWASGGFAYYIDVDIWTENGVLNNRMCSYYDG